MRSLLRRALPGALALGLALGATACSDDEDEDTEDTETEDTGVEETTTTAAG